MRRPLRVLLSARAWACAGLVLAPAVALAAPPNVALFYGANLPWDELHAFDAVVVEPANVPEPAAHTTPSTALFAYVSVGEVGTERPYLKDIPKAWVLGRNSDWGSTVIDQAQPGWPSFFAERVVKPLWDAGYRGFFLDTLDSCLAYAKTEADRRRQEAGLVEVIHEIKKRYPQARLIFNRGFEILPRTHQEVFAVAAESLFEGWDQSNQTYRAVPAADREWLLGQLSRVKQEYGLPVVAIDYVPAGSRNLARQTAQKIQELGIVPWVTTHSLDVLGVGAIEVMPRKVLMIQNTAGTEYELEKTNSLLYGTLPLNYLGYSCEYLDARRALPSYPLAGRYAGIVVWLEKPPGREGAVLAAWLRKQMDAGVPVAVLGEGEFLYGGARAERLGFEYPASPAQRRRLHMVKADPLVGFELKPPLDRQRFLPLRVADGKPLLTVADDNGEEEDAVAIMPWGGYALDPDVIAEVPGASSKNGENQRWVINPIEFLKRALRLPDMPVPDVTTENGRRLLMVHMDGDGFANKAEFPGFPYAAELLYSDILKKFPLPATISVIEGEVAANGMYPALSKDLEPIARKIFALPNVEIASHSFSHPFSWELAKAKPSDPGPATDGYRLAIPHYTFDLQKEIPGSIAYIERRLAPPGKKVKVFLWTGDCNVGSDALALAAQSGVMTMNGGDTTMTRSDPSLTVVAPLGVAKKNYFQVYAPNQNENVYTNDWLGPFYGFERVIETFELTDAPYRLKPIDVYFHTYSASKPASLKALDKVLTWAERQDTMPVYVSDYVHKVLDFNTMVVARTADGWLVRGDGHLRELRAPLALGAPDLARSTMVAGFSRHEHDQYLHLGGAAAEIRFGKGPPPAPFLVAANARIEQLARSDTATGRSLGVSLHGNVPLQFVLSLNEGCRVNANGAALRADGTGEAGSHFSLPDHDVDELRISCAR